MLKDKVKLTTDSTCDLPQEFLDKSNIDLTYLSVMDTFTGIEYRDRELSNEELFALLKQGHKFKTSCPSIGEYINIFEKHLKDYPKLVHLNMSSKLSGSYQAALTASNEVDPNRITVIDTRQVSMGHGLIIQNAVDYLKKTDGLEEFIDRTKDDISRTGMLGVLHTARYAKNLGRFQDYAGPAFDLAERLKLCALAMVVDGKLKFVGVARGKVVYDHINKLLEGDIDLKRVGIGVTSNMEELDVMQNNIPRLGDFGNVERYQAGTIVSTHMGPRTRAIAYTRK